MKAETNVKEPLRDELERLETALDTPPVPGELTNWATMLRKSVDGASTAILAQIETVHPDQIREIEGQDADLLSRTQQLREVDQANRDWCKRLTKAFADFERKTARAGADEKQVIEEQQALLEDGLRFVTHVRKQETAIRSWMQEAFERDTGLAD
ncbi:MAG TPA: hypothetical protein VHX68_02740 [Planctomycetaceae bacterium]|nr:hypothetical protein [Planctomycetaceae bacterium]